MNYINFGDISTQQIQIFLTAAETENFSKTARILNVTQPYVSHAILQLERTLGFNLFSRLAKKVQITPAGRILYESWNSLFSSFTQAINLAYGVAQQWESTLSIVDKAGTNKDYYLYPITKRFSAAYQNVQISISQTTFEAGLEMVAKGAADVGFCYRSEIEKTTNASINWKELISRPFYAFVPASSPIYNLESVTPEQLATVPIMLCDPAVDPHYNNDTLNIFKAHGLCPNVRGYAKDGMALMIQRNLSDAVIILTPYADETGARDVRRIPIENSSSSLVLYWNNASKKKNVKEFLDIALDYFLQEQ